MYYELWDDRQEKSIGRWESQTLALRAVRELLEGDDVMAVAALVLRTYDWNVPTETIAAGSQLVAMARRGTGDEWTQRRVKHTAPTEPSDPSGTS